MKILVTGAFGNIGFSTIQALIRDGHQVRCFDRKSKQSAKRARQIEGKGDICWGDIRQAQEVALAVQDQDIIVHLAAILPPEVDEDHATAAAINVGGTRHLLQAVKQQKQPPKILFSSSLDVFGFTQDQPPPRRVSDPVQATDEYTRHKLECEEMIMRSGLDWAIFRFADVPPLAPRSPHPIMYRIPLNTRFEMLHTYDAGLAIANGVVCEQIWGKIWLIGGGPTCQICYRDYLEGMMDVIGIGKLPEQAFGADPYCTDWLDTQESQQLLQYQRYSFDDIIRDLARFAGPPRPVKLLMPLIRPLVRMSILKLSPYLKHRTESS